MKRNKRIDFVYFIFLLVLGLILFKQVFQLGICCDDYFLLRTLKPQMENGFPLKLFVNPYGSQYFILFLINLFFGYNSFYYFFIPFLLRLLASFSIYLFTNTFFNNRVIGLMVSSLYMVGFAGIEIFDPVNSVINLSIIFLLSGLIFYKKYLNLSINKINNRYLYLTLLCFFIALVISPIRMHGLLFLYPLLELGLYITGFSKLTLSIKRVIFFILVVFLVKLIGFFNLWGSATVAANPLQNLIKLIQSPNLVEQLFYPLLTFYNMVIPPQLQSLDTPSYSRTNLLIILSIPVLFINLVIIKKTKKLFPFSLIIFSWIIFLLGLNSVYNNFSPDDFLKLFLGGLIIFAILQLTSIIEFMGQRILVLKMLFFLIWPFMFILVYHLSQPLYKIESNARYLIISSLGIYLIISVCLFYFYQLISNTKNNLLKFLVFFTTFFIFMVIFTTNYFSTKSFFNDLADNGASDRDIKYLFNTMNKELFTSQNSRPIIFITYDEQKFAYLAILYGGQERFFLLNNLDPNKEPLILTQFEDLQEGVLSNKFKIENIYGFDIKKRKISVTTDSLRKDLEKIIP